MSTEQNKAVVRRFFEAAISTMDTALVDELFASDYVNHMMPGGREGFKQFFTNAAESERWASQQMDVSTWRIGNCQ